MLDHDDDGALGVVINRPTPVPSATSCRPGSRLRDRPGVLFQGGPVAPDSALGLAVLPGDGTDASRSAGGGCRRDSAWSTWTRRPSCSAAELAGCGSSPATPAGAPGSSRTSSTRAPGTSCESDGAGDAFTAHPERLWRAVLRRQGGELAMVATYPDDPSLN